MRYFLIFIISGSFLLSSCITDEEKARELIEPVVKSELLYPDSYEFEGLRLDSCFSDSDKNPELCELVKSLAGLYRQYRQCVEDAEDAEHEAEIYGMFPDESMQRVAEQYRKDAEKFRKKADFIKRQILRDIDEKRGFLTEDCVCHDFIGWIAYFRYRSSLQVPDEPVVVISLFFLDKDLKEVLYNYGSSLDDAISAISRSNSDSECVLEMTIEFEEELSCSFRQELCGD